MRASEAVRALLRSKGCADETADAGLEGLVGDWERTVREVSWGYPLGLDDYLISRYQQQLMQQEFEERSVEIGQEVSSQPGLVSGRVAGKPALKFSPYLITAAF